MKKERCGLARLVEVVQNHMTPIWVGVNQLGGNIVTSCLKLETRASTKVDYNETSEITPMKHPPY